MGVYGETAEPLSGVQESFYAGGERIYSGGRDELYDHRVPGSGDRGTLSGNI